VKKGVDWALYRKVVVNKQTGEIASDKLGWLRPPYGIKELNRRHKAKKAAKQARKRNRGR
jgi:hypothetical protein